MELQLYLYRVKKIKEPDLKSYMVEIKLILNFLNLI